MNHKVREHISFEGRVQEVGFRYKMHMLADRYHVTGWVRNEYDGSVSAEAQGYPEDIDRVIQELYQDRYIQIEWISRRQMELMEEETGFRERY